MLPEQDKHEILSNAKTPTAETYHRHVEGFVANFVRSQYRERWREFLLQRPKQLSAKSSKLHSHLDWNFCAAMGENAALVAQSENGIYFDFYDEPKILTFTEAFHLGFGTDALFFIEIGKKVVFFFHEDESYLCQK